MLDSIISMICAVLLIEIYIKKNWYIFIGSLLRLRSVKISCCIFEEKDNISFKLFLCPLNFW